MPYSLADGKPDSSGIWEGCGEAGVDLIFGRRLRLTESERPFTMAEL